jgi:YCII-related domain
MREIASKLYGKRVRFSGAKRTVIDGPFTETKELIAGFWLWQVRSMEEAVEWVTRCPNPHEGEAEIEIRQVFEADDFGSELTPELRKQELPRASECSWRGSMPPRRRSKSGMRARVSSTASTDASSAKNEWSALRGPRPLCFPFLRMISALD